MNNSVQKYGEYNFALPKDNLVKFLTQEQVEAKKTTSTSFLANPGGPKFTKLLLTATIIGTSIFVLNSYVKPWISNFIKPENKGFGLNLRKNTTTLPPIVEYKTEDKNDDCVKKIISTANRLISKNAFLNNEFGHISNLEDLCKLYNYNVLNKNKKTDTVDKFWEDIQDSTEKDCHREILQLLKKRCK